MPDLVESIVGDDDVEEFLEDLRKSRPSFYQQLLVQTVQILEVYWDDILKLIYNRNLRDLIVDDKQNKKRTMSYEAILRFEDFEELQNYIADEIIGEHKRWVQRKTFFKKLKINFDDSGFTSRELNILIQQRNLIIHRKGIVDQHYLNETKDTNWKLDDEIAVSDTMVNTALDNVYKLSEFIDKKVISRYL